MRMDDAMTNTARTPRFLDQVEDSTSLAMGAKVQVWGGPETGKSHDAYENLPRPLIVVDSDVSAGLFNEDLVHPRARGSDLLGHLFDISLQRSLGDFNPGESAEATETAAPVARQMRKKTFIQLRFSI